MTGFAWHLAPSGDYYDGTPTGPYCYDCVPKGKPPWRHRLPRPGDEVLARLEAEARRQLGRRFSWVHMVDDPQTGDRSLTIQGQPLADRSTPSVSLTASAKAIRMSSSGSDGRLPEALSIPLATEPALVIAQVGVLVAAPGGARGSHTQLAQ